MTNDINFFLILKIAEGLILRYLFTDFDIFLIKCDKSLKHDFILDQIFKSKFYIGIHIASLDQFLLPFVTVCLFVLYLTTLAWIYQHCKDHLGVTSALR